MARDLVTIVSGLPRSGTSMMMQMLEAGGLPALTDEIRKADDDNPKGYYEFEPVKKTKQDPSWLESARGKVVKIVYRLLYDLPAGYSYRVVFMQRRIEEVLASQRLMLTRLGKEFNQADDAKLAELFRAQVKKCQDWLATRPNFATLAVDYNQLIATPRPQVERLAEFLGPGLDVDAMLHVVDPALYRQRG